MGKLVGTDEKQIHMQKKLHVIRSLVPWRKKGSESGDAGGHTILQRGVGKILAAMFEYIPHLTTSKKYSPIPLPGLLQMHPSWSSFLQFPYYSIIFTMYQSKRSF